MRLIPPTWQISVRVKLLSVVSAIVLLIIAAQAGFNARNARLRSQADATQTLLSLYVNYQDHLYNIEQTAAALATSLADRPDVQTLTAAQNRAELLALLRPLFQALRADYAISHLYIHRPNGYVLLRVHDPPRYGDGVLPYRKTISAAIITRQTVSGAELDPDRLSVRGVAPILRQGELLGLVEVGLNYDQAFIAGLKQNSGAEYGLWLALDAAAPTGLWPAGNEPPSPSKKLFYYANTHSHPLPVAADVYERVLSGSSDIQFVSAENQAWAVLLSPLYGYDRCILGVTEIALSRTQALAALRHNQITAIAATAGLALLTITLMALAAELIVLRSLRHLTQVARQQLEGDLTVRAGQLPHDELGNLGYTLNRLTDRLNTLIGDLEQQVQISQQAREELRARTEELDRFFSVALDLLCIADTDGYFRRVNPQWEHTLGYTLADLDGCRFLDLVHPDDIPATLEAIQDLMADKQVLNFINRYRCRNGEYRWIEWRSFPSGKLIYAAARDMTERKSAEEALRQSETRFRQIVENSPMGMHMYELDEADRLIFVGANPAADRILGVNNAQFIGKTIEAAFPPLVQTEVPARYRQAARRGDPWTTQQVDYQDNDIRGAFEVYAFQSGPGRVTAMFLDITARKQAEDKILQRNTELAALNSLGREINASLSLEHTLTVAMEGILQVVRPDLTLLFMRDGNELVLHKIIPPAAEQWLGIVPPHRLGECLCGLAAAQNKPLYSRRITDDVRCTWQECKQAGLVSFAALPISSGQEVIGVIGLAAGSERNFASRAEFLETLISHISVAMVNARLFETVQGYANELEQRVQARTTQLQAANQELEAFAYSVSHDLRAPLRAMDGFGQALQQDYGDQLDATAQVYIGRIRAAAQRMGELIDGLLHLSRITRGELLAGQVNLSEIAAQVAQELQQTHPDRQIEWHIAPNLSAWGDRRMLRAVLENLLGNAVKFTARQPQARIEVGVDEIPGKRAFWVRDNGVGFDMTYVHKIFGAFQRLHSPGEFPGSGIGLATVQRIIHRHGGQVWAEGQVHQGAAFWFTLPEVDRPAELAPKTDMER